MIDIAYVEKLLPTLKAFGVIYFKTPEFELTLAELPTSEVQAPGPALDPLIQALTKQEESLPPDLRADDIMNADKVLNWSSPDVGDDMPLAPSEAL